MHDAIPRIGAPAGADQPPARSPRRHALARWLRALLGGRPAGPRPVERGHHAQARLGGSAEALHAPIRTLVDPRDIYLA